MDQLIVTDPEICFGKPTIRGTRIWVTLIADLVREGISTEEILKGYPSLSAEAIAACVDYDRQHPVDRTNSSR